MTKSELRAYAKANGISLSEARDRVRQECSSTEQERVRKAMEDGIWTKMFVIVDGQGIEFQHGCTTVPDAPPYGRNELINAIDALARQPGGVGHNGNLISIAAAYVGYSPSLQAAKSGLFDRIINVRTGREQKIDPKNLGCVIEFELDGPDKTKSGAGIRTNGPQWMSPDEVDAIAAEYKQRYADTHDFRHPH